MGGFDFDFNILTAFIRLGRAGPVRGRVPSIIRIIGLVTFIFITIGLVPSILLLLLLLLLLLFDFIVGIAFTHPHVVY
jgi:hypothetical protein